MKLRLTLVVATVLGIAIVSWGGTRIQEKPITDTDYLLGAIVQWSALVKSSELARVKAGASEMRKLAGEIADRQNLAGTGLIVLARDNKDNWEAARRSGEREVEVSGLAKLTGGAFDQAYLKNALSNLDQLIELSERCVNGMGSEGVRSQAKKMLPLLHEQRKQANDLLKTIAK
jgi:predicted outer membrane protein